MSCGEFLTLLGRRVSENPSKGLAGRVRTPSENRHLALSEARLGPSSVAASPHRGWQVTLLRSMGDQQPRLLRGSHLNTNMQSSTSDG